MTKYKMPIEILEYYESDSGELLREDVSVWSKHYQTSLTKANCIESNISVFSALFHFYPEFRTLFDFRIRFASLPTTCKEVKPELRRANDLNLNLGKLGGGAFFQHGNNTWLFARSIGNNFFANHNVTVGQGKGGAPTIGNNVTIRTGAVVVGSITIGSNVFIGANAVVNFDVPDGCRVYSPKSIIIQPNNCEHESAVIKATVIK